MAATRFLRNAVKRMARSCIEQPPFPGVFASRHVAGLAGPAVRSYCSFTFTPFNSSSSFFFISACECEPGWSTYTV